MGPHQHDIDELARMERICLELAAGAAIPEERAGLEIMAATIAPRAARVLTPEAIRDLVDTVTVFRDPARPGGVAVEIAGRLNALLGEAAYPNRVTGVWGKMVAGERLEPPTGKLFTITAKPR